MAFEIRGLIKSALERRGWFLRRMRGLPIGTYLYYDLKARFGCRPRIIFDVGAHRGETSAELTRSFPQSLIFAFEPVELNFQELERAAKHWSRVRCFRCALGSHAGSVSIARKQDSQTYSLRYPAALDDLDTETVTVNTIDAFTATHKVDRIDLLKIDTEGYEQHVLLGAVQVLSENRVGPILLECTLDRADAVHTCFAEVANFLAGFDYHLVAIYDQITWREPIRLAYFNALFARAEIGS